jgi:mono/diheme cytochrome c family protein
MIDSLGQNREGSMRILAVIGALAIIGAIAAGVFFFGGYYNVAATEPDLGVVHWALTQVRAASIDRHAKDNPPAGYDDPAKIQEGARQYSVIGCVNCHGVPMAPESPATWAKFSEGLHPDPPGLKELANAVTPAQLFWVIKNGINMTGMPSFAGAAKDEDLWSIVAFVKKLPIISEADYKSWTATPSAPAPSPTPVPAPTATPTPTPSK